MSKMHIASQLLHVHVHRESERIRKDGNNNHSQRLKITAN